ncbi:MAG: tRNA pseudouridine(55) synthase TruB, partial [Sphingosinicella sp.]
MPLHHPPDGSPPHAFGAGRIHGWLILDKPAGPSSSQAVGRIKRALREGGYPKAKIGHGGTLDPLASGVLPIAIGETTKLAGRLLDSDKDYAFTIRFGAETDTLDAEGGVVATSARRPTLDEIADVLPRFTGEIEQVPPAFSALKIEGQRAYARARAGEEVALAKRRVLVRALRLLPGTGRGTAARSDAVEGSPSGSAEAHGPLHQPPPVAPAGPPPRAGAEV